MIVVVCGLPGAGKTTYASKWAADNRGLVLATDSWMNQLFWCDPDAKAEYDWAIERIGRCEAVMWDLAKRHHELGVSTVLDGGFVTRKHRMRARDYFAGLPFEIHFLDAPQSVRWERVRQRNREQGATFEFEVTDENLRFMEDRFERPGNDEGARIIDT